LLQYFTIGMERYWHLDAFDFGLQKVGPETSPEVCLRQWGHILDLVAHQETQSSTIRFMV